MWLEKSIITLFLLPHIMYGTELSLRSEIIQQDFTNLKFSDNKKEQHTIMYLTGCFAICDTHFSNGITMYIIIKQAAIFLVLLVYK